MGEGRSPQASTPRYSGKLIGHKVDDWFIKRLSGSGTPSSAYNPYSREERGGAVSADYPEGRQGLNNKVYGDLNIGGLRYE